MLVDQWDELILHPDLRAAWAPLVDGALQRHKTWAECETRVKGKRNVKFRKAVSLEDENTVLKDWGVSL